MQHIRYGGNKGVKCIGLLPFAADRVSDETATELDAAEAARRKRSRHKGHHDADDRKPFVRLPGPLLDFSTAVLPVDAVPVSGALPAVEVVEIVDDVAAAVGGEVDVDLFATLDSAVELAFSADITDSAAADQLSAFLTTVSQGDKFTVEHIYERFFTVYNEKFVDPDRNFLLSDVVADWLHGFGPAPVRFDAPVIDRRRVAPNLLYTADKHVIQTDLDGIADPYASMYDDISVAYADRALQEQLDHFVKPIMFVLHLCAGRRRSLDIQQWLEWLWTVEEVVLFVVSVDIAISDDCNLLDPVVADRWLKLAESGAVVATIIGPPCESWSAVRHVQPVDGDSSTRWPRPIRSRILPFGIEGLTHKHYRQLDFANRLLWLGIRFAITAIRVGSMFLLEHPACQLFKPHIASIWYLPYIRWLVGAPAAQLHKFRQIVHGQKSAKPTMLLTVRLQSLTKYIHTKQCDEGFQKVVVGGLHGRNEDGSWRTTSAREYPPSMCKAIATAIVDELLGDYERVGSVGVPSAAAAQQLESMRPFYASFDPYSAENSHHGLDCMLHNRH